MHWMEATLRRALACCAITLDYLLVADMRKEADGALLERIEEELCCLNKYIHPGTFKIMKDFGVLVLRICIYSAGNIA